VKRFSFNPLVLCGLSIFLTACSFEPQDSELRPRTEQENKAITDAWYPIKSEECQLIVDGFSLVTLAMGNGNEKYMLENADEIQQQLELTGDIVSKKFLELAKTTEEESIRDYLLEAVPLFAKLRNLLPSDSEDFETSLTYLEDWAALTGKVPDACKS
jgi:hypothetical protein